ncbi:hypothetical protein OsJ_17356 [Oryza sativa Japonica Group]|uniref:Uncharacterized protein n=1 Tax=Oryza sativa subsp. japonica TaxID=39947 RepID=B9FI81_ORYSJ|nr:hypothetical protein OsJ_17356 [Oryza sativa Japonica Group]
MMLVVYGDFEGGAECFYKENAFSMMRTLRKRLDMDKIMTNIFNILGAPSEIADRKKTKEKFNFSVGFPTEMIFLSGIPVGWLTENINWRQVDLDDAGWCEGRRTAYLEAGSGAGEARVVGFGVPKLGMVGSATSEFRVSGSGAPESMVARTGHRKGEGRRRLVVDRR